MTIFLSDVHLGTRQAKAEKLIDFLKTQDRNETLFLIGDIVDDHPMKAWPLSHQNALRLLLQFKSIIYIPGNHDKFFRHLAWIKFGNVMVMTMWFHHVGDKTYFVTHGDQFDWMIQWTHFISSSIIAKISRRLFHNIHSYMTGHNSSYVKKAVSFAKETGNDGIICGHNHVPAIKKISGIEYINTGDWTENCTAVIEKNGVFELVSFL